MQILGNIVQQLQQQNNNVVNQFRQLRGNMSIQILLTPMNRHGVDVVFDIINDPQFKKQRQQTTNPDNIDVIVDSLGGDADASYHIAKLLDSHFDGKIAYIVPRFAKSAATLMVCGGNNIIMGETSELGPLDPQIRQDDGNYISAKAVQSTLELIKKHLKAKDKTGLELATILASRLNPLVLGQYESTLNIAQEYQKELLLLRMFSSKREVAKIVKRFATGYTHHSRVIGCREAQEIFGNRLEIMPSSSQEWRLIWQFYETNKNIANLLGALKIIEKYNDNKVNLNI